MHPSTANGNIIKNIYQNITLDFTKVEFTA
jgi:hypothetical protein